MNRDKRDNSILLKIIKYCDEIADARISFGDSSDALKSNIHYKNSVSMSILQIGELVGHLSEGFRQGHTEMPWRAMRQMRNVAAHDYDNFDIGYVWDTVTNDIPALRSYCQRIIEQHEAGAE